MSAPSHIGPREARRRAARELLIKKSTSLLRTQGFDETTLGAIAAAANMTVPTLLTHFPSKEHLALSYEFDTLADFAARLAAAGPEVPTMEIWRDLGRVVLSAEPFTFAAFARRWVWIASTPSLDRAVLRLAQDYADVLEQGFRADLGSRVRQPECRVRARTVAHSLAFSNFATLLQWGAEGAPDDLPQRLEQVIAMIERMIGPNGMDAPF